MPKMKVALVGIGKIALDQHVPAIAASPDWELAATVSRKGSVPGVPAFTDFAAFLAEPDESPKWFTTSIGPRFFLIEQEGYRALERGLWLVAYDYCLKLSHLFNVLDARGAISVSERARRIQRVRALAVRVAQTYEQSLAAVA